MLRVLAWSGAAAVGIAAAAMLWPWLADAARRFLALPAWQRAFAALFLALFVAYGGSKTNQVDQTDGTNVVGRIQR